MRVAVPVMFATAHTAPGADARRGAGVVRAAPPAPGRGGEVEAARAVVHAGDASAPARIEARPAADRKPPAPHGPAARREAVRPLTGVDLQRRCRRESGEYR